jgi:ankyrin repeat protein
MTKARAIIMIQRKFRSLLMKKRLNSFQKIESKSKLSNRVFLSPARLSLAKTSVTTTADTKQFTTKAFKNKRGVSKFSAVSKNVYDAIKRNIMVAVKNDNIKYIEKKSCLLKAECFNFKDIDGNTPLHYAAKHEYPNMVKLLIKIGVKINEQNKRGDTPLHLAFKGNNHEVGSALKSR